MLTREQVSHELQQRWKVKGLKFYGEFFRPRHPDGEYIKPQRGERAYGFMRNLLANDKKIYYPEYNGLEYERKVSFKVPMVEGLEDGKYYWVELEPEEDEKRKVNPYLLKVKAINILEHDFKSPREFIKDWFFKKGENPPDASTIASQLKLNELELYTHTKRFIFELVQNADDMPLGKNNVKVAMHLLKNHLLFLHNGKFFDRKDVMAISDAAKSTKSEDKAKTGYKGIGFKSVFTDSFRVYIKSAEYSFKYDKLEPVYKDFWKLYEGYFKKLNREAQAEFRHEYKGKELLYTDIDNIPWQIKPIWVEPTEYPEELLESDFRRNHQVAIALEIGESIIRQKKYHEMICGLLNEPRFLLFLRNTDAFKYNGFTLDGKEESYHLELKGFGDVTVVYSNGQLVDSYIKGKFAIEVTNEGFLDAGLGFQKRLIEGGKVVFYDDNGQKLENIPEKLGRLDSSIISFAAQIKNGSISKLSADESILFNYLPTSDQRFEFPFLVNSDFVSKTDREFIQIENKWNHYLFYHIGYNSIVWLQQLAGNKEFHSSYMNLLPLKYKDEKDQELSLINRAYNNGLRKALSEISFIINEDAQLSKSDEVVIDDTGISLVLGKAFFHEFTGNPKKLPHFKVNKSILKREFLQCEVFTSEKLVSLLQDPDKNTCFAQAVGRLNKDRYLSFLGWFDTFVKDNEKSLAAGFYLVPFLRFGNSVCSSGTAFANEGLLINHPVVSAITDLLPKLGILLSEVLISNYPFIMARLLTGESYLTKPEKLYEKLTSNKDFRSLMPHDKVSLLRFLSNLNGIGEAKYAKALPLFRTVKGAYKSLSDLISADIDNLPLWLQDFRINKNEQSVLAEFSKHLISKSNIFSRVLLKPETFQLVASEITSQSLSGFYADLIRLYNDDQSQEKTTGSLLNAIPWLFIDNATRFKKAAEVYCPDLFLNLKESQFINVRNIITESTGLMVPDFQALKVVAPFLLGCKKDALTNNMRYASFCTLEEANDFLDFLKASKEATFFKKWGFVETQGGYNLVQWATKNQYYATGKLNEYISSSEALSGLLTPLPNALYSAELHNLSLLEDKALVRFILSTGEIQLELASVIYLITEDDIHKSFLQKLSKLNLYINKIYSEETSEHKVLSLLLSYSGTDPQLVQQFVAKISVQGKPLAKQRISDEIVFSFDTALNIKTPYKLKLSEVLASYQDETGVLNNIIESFPVLNQETLKNSLFHLAYKDHSEIFKEIKSQQQPFISSSQILFLILYSRETGNNKVFEGLVMFDDYYGGNARDEVVGGYTDFLERVYRLNFTDFSGGNGRAGFYFLGFNPEEHIYGSNLVVEFEVLPDWVGKWINREDVEKRVSFLSRIGLNTAESHIVNLRKALLDRKSDDSRVALLQIKNEWLLINTLQWLEQKKDALLIKDNISIITEILSRLKPTKENIAEIPLPIITEVSQGSRTYSLIYWNEQIEYHCYLQTWQGYEAELFAFVHNNNGLVFQDDLPESFDEVISIKVLDPQVAVDEQALEDGSVALSADYYQSWELKETYVIKVYKDTRLPMVLKYNGSNICDLNTGKTSHVINNKFYVSFQLVSEIPQSLPDSFPPEVKWKLFEWKNSFEKEKKKGGNEHHMAERYSATFEKAIKGRLDLGDIEKIRRNGVAFEIGVGFLLENDYKMPGENQFVVPYGVRLINESTGLEELFLFSSAVGGLLFLDPIRLNLIYNERYSLVVLYPGNECRRYNSIDHIINNEENEFLLLRTKNTKDPVRFMEIVNSHQRDGAHFIFATSEHMRKSLFEIQDKRKDKPNIEDPAFDDD